MTNKHPKKEIGEFHYKGPDPTQHEFLPGESVHSLPLLEGELAINLGVYQRKDVTNVDLHPSSRAYFDLGLRLLFSYKHELASKCFLACLKFNPYTALAHGLVAICHSPNYNFKGRAYYESACHFEDQDKEDALCIFPSQQVADRHSKKALDVIEEIKKMHKKNKSGGKKGRNKKKLSGNAESADKGKPKPALISDVEVKVLQSIRTLCCYPGIDPSLSEEMVGRPYANACRAVYEKYPDDPEVAYLFAESLVVLNAWQLYEYPSGKPVSPDVGEVQDVLEKGLDQHKTHAGLSHMYVHLSEMSATPEQALRACPALRSQFPHAGHLIHMPTHIDVLIGDYESCVKYNCAAIEADSHVRRASPSTAGTNSFYFGYIVHNYHMAVYGALLGGMQKKAMEVANELNVLLTEQMFAENPDLTSYLESYSALDIHVMVRFGEWDQILELTLPQDKQLMLYRTASLYYARGLAYATKGMIKDAKLEAERLDGMRGIEEAHFRILHNNSVAELLALDSVMMKGEIAYHDGQYDKAFELLRKAVEMQDNLAYDEPWGKMQPIRHALGGLLFEQGHVEEAEAVFRKDLEYHAKNPWALQGLIRCLKSAGCCAPGDEVLALEEELKLQRACKWADFNVVVPCECCKHPDDEPQ